MFPPVFKVSLFVPLPLPFIVFASSSCHLASSRATLLAEVILLIPFTVILPLVYLSATPLSTLYVIFSSVSPLESNVALPPPPFVLSSWSALSLLASKSAIPRT